MPATRRLAKPVLLLAAVAIFALVLSACAVYKLGSLELSQPGGVGSVRVHFEICTEPEPQEDGSTTCNVSKSEGQLQAIVGIAVPKGSSAPGSITATPLQGGAPIVFTRNDQAAQSMAQATAGIDGGASAWPPPGSEGVGYLSAPFNEEKGVLREWSVDADFGLPSAADGGPFGGPFPVATAYGLRGVGGESGSAERPVACVTNPMEVTDESAFCAPAEKAEIGTSDLKIAPAPRVNAFPGGKATLSFPLDFASTATTLPSFNLAATSTLPKARVTLPSRTFTPGAPVPVTHRSPTAPGTVEVTVPKRAKPGVYDVTLTATTPQGGVASQVAKLRVTKPKIRLGQVKLNEAKGTATLFVRVPSAGSVSVSGKQIGRAKRTSKAKGAKTLKLPVKPKGKAKAQLAQLGRAKVKAKVTFKPASGAAVTRSRSIVLKKNVTG